MKKNPPENPTKEFSNAIESAIRFSEREIELAHQMAALGVNWTPMPGMIIYDDQERFGGTSPLQNHVYVILDYPLFLKIAGGLDRLRNEWTWLPSWEEARSYLKMNGMNNAEVLDRVRERVVDTGMTDREAIYEIIVTHLRSMKTERS